MSGIAELLVNLGYDVSGSDRRRSPVTDRLAGLGVQIAEGHGAEHVRGADVVVTSSAIPRDNPEVREAERVAIPVIPRAEMLAELMRLRFGVAVAGAHGKTTTSSMVACVLEHAGLDPTAVIGGLVVAFGSNARLGRSEYMVVEADESDRSFLRLTPSIAVITNIDREHLESYADEDHLATAFLDFADKVPFYGAVVACVDDGRVRALVPRMSRRVITYGVSADAELAGLDLELGADGSRCVVWRCSAAADGGRAQLGDLLVGMPGRHNLLNGLAAVAVGLELGVAFESIAAALGEFRGVERRLEVCGTVDGVTVIDDYAHHPTEIAAVLAAVRLGHPGRIVAVFQPHRYSRTADLVDEFGRALASADTVVLTDIYPAGEAPVPGVDLEAVADAVRRVSAVPVHLVPALERVAPVAAALARSGDTVLTLGAGSIGSVARAVVRELEALHRA